MNRNHPPRVTVLAVLTATAMVTGGLTAPPAHAQHHEPIVLAQAAGQLPATSSDIGNFAPPAPAAPGPINTPWGSFPFEHIVAAIGGGLLALIATLVAFFSAGSSGSSGGSSEAKKKTPAKKPAATPSKKPSAPKPKPSAQPSTPAPAPSEPERIPYMGNGVNEIKPKLDTFISPDKDAVSVTGEMGERQTAVVNIPIEEAPKVGQVYVLAVGRNNADGVLGRVTKTEKTTAGLTQITTDPVTIADAYDKFEVSKNITPQDIIEFDPGYATVGTDRAALSSQFNAYLFCNEHGLKSTPVKTTVDFENMRVDASFGFRDGGVRIGTDYVMTLESDEDVVKETNCTWPDEVKPKLEVGLGPKSPVSISISPKGELKLKGNVGPGNSLTVREPVDLSFGWGKYGPAQGKNEPSFQWGGYEPAELDAQVDMGFTVALGRILSGDLDFLSVHKVKVKRTEERKTKDGKKVIILKECKNQTYSRKLWGGFRASVLVISKEIGIDLFTKEMSKKRQCDVKNERVEGEEIELPTPAEPEPKKPNLNSKLGSLSGLTVDQFLRCRVDSPHDGRSVFYGDDHCSTSLAVALDRETYSGDDWITTRGFDAVSGPEVSGAGTAADPLVIRTRVRPKDRPFLIEQVDTFVEGKGRFMTTINVINEGSKDSEVIVYRGVDCYLNNDDWGTGVVTERGAACVAADGRQIAFESFTDGERKFAGHYADNWVLIRDADDLPNFAAEGVYDNGMSISWRKTLKPGEKAEFRSSFELREPADFVPKPAG